MGRRGIGLQSIFGTVISAEAEIPLVLVLGERSRKGIGFKPKNFTPMLGVVGLPDAIDKSKFACAPLSLTRQNKQTVRSRNHIPKNFLGFQLDTLYLGVV